MYSTVASIFPLNNTGEKISAHSLALLTLLVTSLSVLGVVGGCFISGVDALESALLIVDVSEASSGGGALEEIDKFYIP